YLYVFLLPRLPSSPLFPYTTLFRSSTTSRPSTGSRPRSPTASASASVEAAAGRAAVGSICSAVHAGANRGVRVTAALSGEDVTRSEERRVGKEGGYRGGPESIRMRC